MKHQAIRSLTYLVTAVAALSPLMQTGVVEAACAPSGDFGVVTSSVTLPAGSYKAWSRMAAANTTGNTYMLEIDGTCKTVGGASVPTYSAADVTNKTRFKNDTSNWFSASFTLGTVAGDVHTVKMYGNADGVVLDRLIFLASTDTCQPSGAGDNCLVAPNQPPIVNITSPTDGATNVTSPVAVTVNASDTDGTISKVELYVDGALNGSPDVAAPYSFSPTLSPGQHTLRAMAYDNSSATTTSSDVVITVRDGVSPAVSITDPLNGATKSGTMSLSATATDNVGVTRAEVSVDSQPPQTITAPSPTTPFNISTSIDTLALSNGAHQITVRVYDAANNSASATVSITVSNTGGSDTTPPTAELTNPAPVASGSPKPIIAGKAYSIGVKVSDTGSGVKQAVLKIDGTVIATLTAAPYTYVLDTRPFTTGVHTISLQATDNANLTSASNASNTFSINITELADINRNCKVSFADISYILPRINVAASYDAMADINNNGNGDGKLSFADVSAILPRLDATTGKSPCINN